jgi:hypothetical protein
MKPSEDNREISREEARRYDAPNDFEIESMFAAGVRQNEEEEEQREAQEHALEYMHECYDLRSKLRELQSNHELELARLETQYQAQIADLKAAVFNISEMVEYVKAKFSLASAKDFKTMCYRLFLNRGERVDEDTVKLLDGIDEVIRQREAKRQIIEIPTAGQVNISPKMVVNHIKDEE